MRDLRRMEAKEQKTKLICSVNECNELALLKCDMKNKANQCNGRSFCRLHGPEHRKHEYQVIKERCLPPPAAKEVICRMKNCKAKGITQCNQCPNNNNKFCNDHEEHLNHENALLKKVQNKKKIDSKSDYS